MVIGTLEDADDYKATKAAAISLLVAFVVRMVKRRRESSDARLTASSTIRPTFPDRGSPIRTINRCAINMYLVGISWLRGAGTAENGP